MTESHVRPCDFEEYSRSLACVVYVLLLMLVDPILWNQPYILSLQAHPWENMLLCAHMVDVGILVCHFKVLASSLSLLRTVPAVHLYVQPGIASKEYSI